MYKQTFFQTIFAMQKYKNKEVYIYMHLTKMNKYIHIKIITPNMKLNIH